MRVTRRYRRTGLDRAELGQRAAARIHSAVGTRGADDAPLELFNGGDGGRVGVSADRERS